MAEWMFIDQATINVRSGDGGDGSVSFRREKYVPKGGPDGGNGGNGGSVIIKANEQLATLLDFRYKRNYSAQRGEPGKGARKTGKSGENTTLLVPCGTIVRDETTNEILADLVDDADEVVVAQGGKGGRGNSEFATSTDQAPRRAEKGKPGKERILILELKLLADVGIVGLPNAGKSTLISRLSAAKPKIADYPFTTLVPNLGIVRYGEYQSFVVADMPGLIEGAHQGRGLGIQFLRHIERTRVLLYLIECMSTDPKEDYRTLANELRMYDPALAKKPHIIAVSKMDLAGQAQKRKLAEVSFGRGKKPIFFSSVDGSGLRELVEALWKALVNASR